MGACRTRQIFPSWAGISFRPGGLRAGFVEARPEGKAKFFRAGKAGGWRKALSEQQVAQLIEAQRESLIEFG